MEAFVLTFSKSSGALPLQYPRYYDFSPFMFYFSLLCTWDVVLVHLLLDQSCVWHGSVIRCECLYCNAIVTLDLIIVLYL
jgi:hypothetical protein